MRDIKNAFSNARETLLADAAGLAALVALLAVSLHLPAVF